MIPRISLFSFLGIFKYYFLISVLCLLTQVNRLRLDSGDFEDAPEMHHIEAAFVDTVL